MMATEAGTFELQVEVEEGTPQGQRCPQNPPGEPRVLALRVAGEMHVGGVMLMVAEEMGVLRDWSDHALWWPQRRRWLLRPGRTLDSLGVGGDSRLSFTPRHRPLLLLLPNRRRLRLRLDFARSVAGVVAQACGLLGIRHPEELSLLRPEEGEGEGEGGGGGKGRRPPQPPDFDLTHLRPPTGENGAWPEPLPPDCLQVLLAPRGGLGPTAPPRPPRGNALVRRAKVHGRWLDASRSLLEQEVGEGEELLLRFKFLCPLDLDPQREGLRLALLFEQGRWAVLSEELDCTEEEMLLFAALQYQVDEVGGSEPGGDPGDLDTALSNLQLQLEGTGTQPPGQLEELTEGPELAEELEIYRPRKLTLRGFRPTWAVLKGTTLTYGPSPPRGPPGDPPTELNLRGCEVTPEVDGGGQKFCIKLLVAGAEGMSEIQLRCRDAPQFARWVSGCRLASLGRSLGEGSLGEEARGVLGVLGVLGDGGDPGRTPGVPLKTRAPPDPRVLLPPGFLRKAKVKQLVPRILSVLHRLGALSPTQARIRFLDAWRALPGYGLAYFLVRFKGSRRDEVLGVGPSRLLRLEVGNGAITRAWRYTDLRQWNVNWDTQQVTLELAGEVTLGLWVLSAPCRVLHQFLGGYLALGGRRLGQPLDPQLLQRLEGGDDDGP